MNELFEEPVVVNPDLFAAHFVAQARTGERMNELFEEPVVVNPDLFAAHFAKAEKSPYRIKLEAMQQARLKEVIAAHARRIEGRMCESCLHGEHLTCGNETCPCICEEVLGKKQA